MDSFAVVLLGGIGVFVVVVWLLGRFYPGNGLEQIGLRSAREITETREALDAEDLDQMLTAHNARRRARGEPELTNAELEQRVMGDIAAERRRQEEYLADRDLDELLEVTNARRRRRGLPERTKEQVRAEFGGGGRFGGSRHAGRDGEPPAES